MTRIQFLTRFFIFAALCCVFQSTQAYAHSRTYAFNEEYRTLAKGSFEVESATKFKLPDTKQTDANQWEFQQELEYGVTDHWSIEIGRASCRERV